MVLGTTSIPSSTTCTSMSVTRPSNWSMWLLKSGDRCWTTTNTMPVQIGMLRNTKSNASSPPAEAPIPTIIGPGSVGDASPSGSIWSSVAISSRRGASPSSITPSPTGSLTVGSLTANSLSTCSLSARSLLTGSLMGEAGIDSGSFGRLSLNLCSVDTCQTTSTGLPIAKQRVRRRSLRSRQKGTGPKCVSINF